MRAANTFNFDHLRSRSLSHRPCSLAVVLHTYFHGLAVVHVGVHGTFNCEIFECAHLKLMVSGRPNKQTSIDTHMCNAVMLVWGSPQSN